MIHKIILILMAGVLGFLSASVNVPAGWLIGSLVFSVFYRIVIGQVTLSPRLFDMAMAVIGVNIGLTMTLNMIPIIAGYAIPLVISLVVMLFGSWFLSKLLAKSPQIDSKTALFSCMPGGASVMMALSEQYHADQPIVAAFQTARIIMLVSMIPLFAGLMTNSNDHHTSIVQQHSFLHPMLSHASTMTGYLIIILMIVVAIWLATKFKIAAASFLYAMIIGLIVNQFIISVPTLPDTIIGLGQVILGVIIGLRFNKESFKRLKQTGLLSITVLILYLSLSFIISLVFFSMTSLDFVTSMLSMVPGGAPQMASTAAILHLNSSVVASLQLVRLLIVFLLIPVLIPLLIKQKKVTHKQ